MEAMVVSMVATMMSIFKPIVVSIEGMLLQTTKVTLEDKVCKVISLMPDLGPIILVLLEIITPLGVEVLDTFVLLLVVVEGDLITGEAVAMEARDTMEQLRHPMSTHRQWFSRMQQPNI
jgi:hypothetical protein